MDSQGYFSLILHAHLPFVRHPEYDRFLEEDWLFEAITECYLPLLDVLEDLRSKGVPYQISLVLTPTLLSMLADPLLRQRFLSHLERLIALAEEEVQRTSPDPALQVLAEMYLERFRRTHRRFQGDYGQDLVAPFASLARSGHLEIFTSAATHAFLPLLQSFPEAVAAQVALGVQTHRRLLGCDPRGFWLPECGFYEGLDRTLQRFGLTAIVTDAHGLLHARPRPLFGVFAPIISPHGVAAFGRDIESSRQVWSAREGYPGDPEYREFYRDIGFDLDLEYLRPYLLPSGERKNTGIKYHRITGPTPDKQLYRPGPAAHRAEEHAGHFVMERCAQVARVRPWLAHQPPVIVAPYDAELFGHWWFEGPVFLGAVLKKLAEGGVLECLSPLEVLRRHPTQQVAMPAFSSWGQNGFCEVWLNPSNDWVYPHIHRATAQMIALANRTPQPGALQRRALNQAARELLLVQSSDWAFMMRMGTTVHYAVRRVLEHLGNFDRLVRGIQSSRLRPSELAEMEGRYNPFPDLDYRCFRSPGGPA